LNLQKSTKYNNILRNNKVAVVIDDLKSIDPWDPRGVKICGTAVITREGGYMEGIDNANHTYIRKNLRCSSTIEEIKQLISNSSMQITLGLCSSRISNIRQQDI
jgi:hypothetical protein